MSASAPTSPAVVISAVWPRAGVGSAAPPWGEAGIVFSMVGCGKITHTELSKQRTGGCSHGNCWVEVAVEARGGRLWLGPDSLWSQESAKTDPEDLVGGLKRSDAQGVPRGRPVSQGQGRGQHPGLSALLAVRPALPARDACRETAGISF